MRTHIAFVSFPHPPNLNPTIPIATALVRRGCRVSYVTSSQFAARVAETGADIIRCPTFDSQSILMSDRSWEIDIREPVLRLATDTLAATASFFEENRPDLFICDVAALAGRTLAGKWKIPAIQTSPLFALDPENLNAQIPDPEIRRANSEFSHAAQDFMRRHGVGLEGSRLDQEKLCIQLFPRALQLPGKVFGEEYFYAGRCAAEQPYYGQWIRHDADRPLVLVSNSTTYSCGAEYFRMCIEALSGLGWHVIFSIGDRIDPASLGRLPPHFELVRGTAHVKVLPHVSLFICPGGIVTTAEALYHGVPLIAASQGVRENEWIGENIPRLGVGVHLKITDMSVAKMREAAVQVRNDRSILENVKQLQHVIRRDAGGEETANRIEEYIQCQS